MVILTRIINKKLSISEWTTNSHPSKVVNTRVVHQDLSIPESSIEILRAINSRIISQESLTKSY